MSFSDWRICSLKLILTWVKKSCDEKGKPFTKVWSFVLLNNTIVFLDWLLLLIVSLMQGFTHTLIIPKIKINQMNSGTGDWEIRHN